MIRRPPRSTQSRSSAASDVYKRQAGDVEEEQVEHREEPELEHQCDRVVHSYSTSKVRLETPSVIWSPGSSRASSTRRPLTLMPFVEPRSTAFHVSPSCRTSAWRRDTFGSSITRSQSRLRPITTAS